MLKRKATNEQSQQSDNKTNNKKKVRTQLEKPAVLGKLYWNGEDEHVVITEAKQAIMVQGISLEAQLDEVNGLTLFRYEEKCNKDEKYTETALHVENQLKHRRSELKHHKEIVANLNTRLMNDVGMSEKAIQELEDDIKRNSRIVRLHNLNIQELLAKTKVGVHFQMETTGLHAVLPAGRLLRPAFLPKTVCWVPVEMSLDVPCVALPVRTEDKFEELPFGLGEADYDWLRKNHKTASVEGLKAKVSEYRVRAEAGNMYGQHLLGRCYLNGLGGVAKDEERAAELFALAAEQGLARAQCSLGVCYECGKGVAEDKKRAVELYTLAAEQGYARAQYNLGVSNEDGSGVEMDLDLARHWYGLAAAQGDQDAIAALAVLDA